MKNNAVFENGFPRSNFLLLFISRLISDLGMAVFKFSLSLYILDVTGSASYFSLILTLTILPGAIMNVFAGVIVDKYDKKKIIIISDILCSLLVFVIFFILQDTNNANVMLFSVYVICISIIQTFLNLSINSSLSNLLEDTSVPKANSMFQSMGAIINILGPLISSALYVILGIKFIVLINAITYLIGAFASMLLHFKYNNQNVDDVSSTKYIENLKFGFSYIKKEKIIQFFLINLLMLNFVYMPLTMLVVQYITYKVLEVSEFQLSIIQAFLGIGVIIGAIYISVNNSIEKSINRFPLYLGALTIGVGFWMFPLLTHLGVLSKSQLVIGYSVACLLVASIYTISIIPIYTYFQTRVPENIRGRIFGVATSALNISIPIGVLIYGFLLEQVHWLYVIVISTLILLILCFYSWRYLLIHKNSFISSTTDWKGAEEH
ncbi:MFS transporter [Lysinibacillus xylanilyticus]|uniref:MFS transporter n=1 Tax=Lysinibacillus xylanilyticus TaxID=582475 RepID=UPI0036D8572A